MAVKTPEQIAAEALQTQGDGVTISPPDAGAVPIDTGAVPPVDPNTDVAKARPAKTYTVTLPARNEAGDRSDYKGCINGTWFQVKRGEPVEVDEAKYFNMLTAGEVLPQAAEHKKYLPVPTIQGAVAGKDIVMLSDQNIGV